MMRSLSGALVALLLLSLPSRTSAALSERGKGGGHLPAGWRWDAYHSHDELAALIKSLGEDYGDNVKVYSIGTRQVAVCV
jgi:hypothetical protein